MRVAITGAGGFFGLALVRAFARDGHAVLAVDRLEAGDVHPRPDTPSTNLTYMRCDVADREALRPLLDADVEAVVHAAALTPTSEGERQDPEGIVDVNLGGTINLLAFARQAPRCKRFVYISSSAVFDQSRPGVLREEDADGGTSLYGAAKLAAEAIVHRYCALFDIGYAAVRPTSLYGPGERPRPSRPNVTQVWKLIDAARHSRPVRIYGDDARSDWLYVDDAAEAVVRLATLEAMPNRVFNLSSATLVPFHEVMDAVAELLPIRLHHSIGPPVDGGPDRTAVIANDRIRRAIDWVPRSPREGIRDYIQTLQQEPEARWR